MAFQNFEVRYGYKVAVTLDRINLLKPTGYAMHHQFNIQQLYALPTLYLCVLYRGADKFLARPWKETSYSDQDLQHYTKTYDIKATGMYCCCLYAISLGIVK